MNSPPNQTGAHYNEARPIELVIPQQMQGLRLDQTLAQLLPDYSRSRIQQWIEQGLVTIQGAPVTIRQKVLGTETVMLTPQPNPAEVAFQPESISLDICFEDECMLVINKPAGLVVHPGHGNWQGTMLNALLAYHPPLAEVPRAGIVHRLDKETSGLLVIAKTLAIQTQLVRLLQQRLVKRIYWALAYGRVNHAGVVDQPIGRDTRDRTRMAVTRSGKPARTHYRILESFTQSTLIECTLESGRTHQIRVHLAHIQHPLVGDPIYGKQQNIFSKSMTFSRQALHAKQLGLPHPLTHEWIEWHSELPEDFQSLLDEIRRMEA